MKIMFISNNENYSFEKQPRGSHALVHFLRQKNEVLALGKKDILNFYRYYLKFKPDVIVSLWVPAGFIPAILNKIGMIKCPLVHAWDDYYAEQMTNYPFWLVNFMEKFTIKNSDYITTVSKYNESLAKKYGKKVFYIPHGVEPRFKKSKIKLDKLALKKTGIKVLYLGEQSRYKKVDKIIEAFKKVEGDLFLLGEINYELREMAKNQKNIHFLEPVPSQEVLSILKQADLLINTSDQDSNFKFFEYIRAGKPILAYDGRPGLIFKHKTNAYLTQNFGIGVMELSKDKKLRKKLSKNVKQLKNQYVFTWEEVAKKHLTVYKEILANKK
jgi:glycosyltransferase involved in cell wall biosynthesis